MATARSKRAGHGPGVNIATRWWLPLCAALLITDAAGDQPQATAAGLGNRLQAHIEFLANDLLRGRQPGTRGYRIAAHYVASQFRQMGLSPAGDGGSYFQQVPLRRAWLEKGSAGMAVHRDGRDRQLEFAEQFYMGPSLGTTQSSVQADMVFAAYGIDAPELDYDDYAGIDAEGKIVVAFAGQPHDFPSEEGAHFASKREKLRAAVSHGAVGVLMIHTPRAARRYQWDRLKSRVGTPAMGWIGGDGLVYGQYPQIRADAMLRHADADIFFEGATHDLNTLLEYDENGQPLPSFELMGQLSMRQRSTHESIFSPNVVAVLPGSDPLLANEYVVYTAHLDHIGEMPAGDGDDETTDRIYNGALDNASGVAVLLETARLLSAGQPAKRSIVFLAVTAEEKGLVGSEYFAMNPTVAPGAIVGAINLDMPLLLYDFADVIAFGASHSTLGDTVRQAASDFETGLSPDPFPEQNIFVRSDHYRFVQQGVPSVFLVTGMRSRGDSVDTQPIFEDFLQHHYHKPGDDAELPINYAAAARFTRINARIGELVANGNSRPDWFEGDFFGRSFSK